MLTQQLRELEEDNIIERKVYNQVPPKVEYYLSDYGQSLSAVLDNLCNWENPTWLICKNKAKKFI